MIPGSLSFASLNDQGSNRKSEIEVRQDRMPAVSTINAGLRDRKDVSLSLGHRKVLCGDQINCSKFNTVVVLALIASPSSF